MTLTLSELIQHLQNMQEELESAEVEYDPKVELHYQSDWPLRARIGCPSFLVERDPKTNEPIIKVALTDRGQFYDNPYGNRAAWEDGNDLNYLMAEFARDNNEEED